MTATGRALPQQNRRFCQRTRSVRHDPTDPHVRFNLQLSPKDAFAILHGLLHLLTLDRYPDPDLAISRLAHLLQAHLDLTPRQQAEIQAAWDRLP